MSFDQRVIASKRSRQALGGPPSAVQDGFADALQQHQSGRLNEAARLCRQILAGDPRHADSLHLLGLTLYRMGQRDPAVELIRRAIASNAGVAAYHSNLGNMIRERGQLDEAVACYRTAIALNPDFADAHFNLATALGVQGRFEDAADYFRRLIVLRPDYPGANFSLGNVLRQIGQPEEAAACYRRAIDLKPKFLKARNNLANMLRQLGKLDEAIACYREILALKPDFPEIANNLGIAFGEQGRLDEAVACYRDALALRPDFPEAHNNLSNALERQGRLDQAEGCFRHALALRPDFPRAHYNLGNVLLAQRQQDEAAICFRRAIALRPDYPEAHNNLGNLLRELGRLEEAVACLRKAVELAPAFAEAHANLGIALLADGDMAGGWAEYEWRWKTPLMIKVQRDFVQPQWRGEAAEGRTLLVHAEQGFGDTLQFCRYAPLAAARGLRVIVEAQRPLVRLLRSLAAVDLVTGRGDALPGFDLHCPMLSMPLALGTTPATIPCAASYLQAEEAQVTAWRTRLAALPDRRRRIGLVWAGSSKLPSDARRSLAPGRLTPLFDLPGVQFFSLQKFGPVAPEGLDLNDLMGEMEDFSDTAALVANLDLVISVDTAVAHLAAALGKPVWLLDRFDSDWRWHAGQRESPWYPTLRRYCQPRPGDWDHVVAEVARDLRTLG